MPAPKWIERVDAQALKHLETLGVSPAGEPPTLVLLSLGLEAAAGEFNSPAYEPILETEIADLRLLAATDPQAAMERLGDPQMPLDHLEPLEAGKQLVEQLHSRLGETQEDYPPATTLPVQHPPA